ncbi:MAG: LysR family transcriptional regulator [Alphaproteobacteria bacterium]|nr:LysR family transcriptional regulator [Alphaproteobacteria bacterium]
MRHSQLKAFHYVALTGGFSRAAEAMNLTQPAVSDQVRKLEAEYDTRLFNRAKKRVRLTKAGQELLEITRPMFEIEAQALELLSAGRAATSGHLRIIADSAYHITGILTRFQASHPKVKISLSTGNSEDVLAALYAYDADIGVLGNMAQNPDFTQITLGTSPIVAFAAKGIATSLRPRASLADIARYNLVLREKGSKTRQKLQEAAAKQGVRLNPVIEAEGREAVHEIVASGTGIGFVSEAEYGQDARLHRFRIDGAPIEMRESIACLSRRRDVRLIRAFMGFA